MTIVGLEGRDGLDQALRWINLNAVFFLFDGVPTRKKAKPALELGIMVYALRRPGGALMAVTPDSFPKIYDLFAALARVDALRFGVIRNVADLLLHTIIVVVLRDTKHSNLMGTDVARAAFNAGVANHEEHLSYLKSEKRMFLEAAGIEHDLPSNAAIVANSMLARRLSALRLSEATAYQLTHNIMFLGALDPADPAYAEADLDRANLAEVLADLLVCFANKAHWDLLGELLLCWDCLHFPQDDLYGGCWALMLDAQDADGSIPGPSSPHGAKRLPDTPATRFGERYHTTLVLALALDGAARRAAMAQPPAWSQTTPRRASRPVYDAGRDLRWLTALLERPGADAPAVPCGVLVGAHLCTALDPALGGEMAAIANRVADRLPDESTMIAAPPALLLVANALLRDHGHTVPALARYVEQLRAVLADVPVVDPGDDLALCEKRILLHALGLSPAPSLLATTRAFDVVAALPIIADGGALERAVLAAESAAGYGTLTALDGAGAASLLSRHAARLLRCGDLANGCAVLRAAHHLRPLAPKRADEFAVDLLLRQGPSGGYGHLVTTDVLPFDRELQLHLPNTLTCLWTLAELRPGFSLYRSIGPDVALHPQPDLQRRS